MPQHSYHSEQLDLVVTITYTRKKAATCFKFLSKRSDATLQSDIAMLGIPPFPHKSLELISQGCIKFSWQNILRNSPLHKTLLKKIRPDDTRDLDEKLADLSIENLELDEFGEDDDEDDESDDESDHDNQDTYEYARKRPNPYDTDRFPGYRGTSSYSYDLPHSGTYGPLHFGSTGPPLSVRLGDQNSIQDSLFPHKKQKVDHPGTFLLQPSTSGINTVAVSPAVSTSALSKSAPPTSSKPVLPTPTAPRAMQELPRRRENISPPSASPPTSRSILHSQLVHENAPHKAISLPSSSTAANITYWAQGGVRIVQQKSNSPPSASPAPQSMLPSQSSLTGIQLKSNSPPSASPVQALPSQTVQIAALHRWISPPSAATTVTRAATSQSMPLSQAVQISIPRKSTSPPSLKPPVISQSPLPAQAAQRSPPIPAAQGAANHSRSEQTSLLSSANAGHSVRETPPSVHPAALLVENVSSTPSKPVNAVPAISESLNIQAVSVQMPNRPSDKLPHSTTPVLKSLEYCDTVVSTSEEHQPSRDIIMEEASASSMSIIQLKLRPQKSSALASASISSLESSNESMLIGLQSELAGAREQLIEALAREDALKSQLLALQGQIAEESRLRMEADDALKDVERECKAPFVVPALLEAFVSISKLTTRSQAKVDVDMPLKGETI